LAWIKAGVWGRMMDAVTAAYDGDIQMIDSTSIRAHQPAATAKRGIEITVSLDRAAAYHENTCRRRCARASIRPGLIVGQAHDGKIANQLPGT